MSLIYLTSQEWLQAAENLSLGVAKCSKEDAWTRILNGEFNGTSFAATLTSIRRALNLLNDDTWPRQFYTKFDTYETSFGTRYRPSFDSVYMKTAIDLSERSTCCRKRVAAIVTSTDNSQILSVGYNGTYMGGPNECDPSKPGGCECLHAEQNCFSKASSSLKSATCYVTLSPCIICAKLLINCGIKRVVYFEEYRDTRSISLMQTAGVTVEKF